MRYFKKEENRSLIRLLPNWYLGYRLLFWWRRQESQKEAKEKLEIQIQETQAKLRAIKAKREAEEPQLLALKAENAQLTADVLAMNQQQAALREKIEQWQKQEVALTDKINDLKFKIVQGRQEIATLKSQIVEPPEKLREQIIELKASAQKEQNNVKDAEEKSRSLQKKYDLLVRLEKVWHFGTLMTPCRMCPRMWNSWMRQSRSYRRQRRSTRLSKKLRKFWKPSKRNSTSYRYS